MVSKSIHESLIRQVDKGRDKKVGSIILQWTEIDARTQNIFFYNGQRATFSDLGAIHSGMTQNLK